MSLSLALLVNTHGVISVQVRGMITWLYWLTWTATLGTEFTAAALLVQEWFPSTSVWAWTLFFGALVFFLNVSSTRLFAESEFWLALVKVITIICFIGLGLLAIFGFIPYQGMKQHHCSVIDCSWLVSKWSFPNFATMLIVNFAFLAQN